jgi:HlyD family secretion protein
MKRKYVYFIGTFTFLCLLLILIFFIGHQTEADAKEDIQVETPSFLSYISGTGIIEPASGNIVISSPLHRLVEKIDVKINDHVQRGDVLFQLYNQDLLANLKTRQKKYEESLSNLHKIETLPRKEDLRIAQETLNREQALFNQSVTEYCLGRKRARRKEDKCLNVYKYQQAEARFLEAQAQFDKVKAGASSSELKIAQTEVEQAKADIESLETEIEETYIKSPIDGTVLQIKIHEGEILDPGKAAMTVGNVEELNLRVAIDQFNEARFHPNCPAVAFRQGDIKTEFPLKFLHIEPFMVPKKYLTNELQERVDTQTFEILYQIEKTDARLFIGEQMDVYIYVDKAGGDCSDLPTLNREK